MASEFHDPRFARQSPTTRHEPTGQYPIPGDSRLRAVECVHCFLPLGISTWDYLNGFLVVCPHCGGYHGKRWGIERTVVAGLFFNALSFFFVFRPRNALGILLVFAFVCYCLVYLVDQDDMNDALMIAAVGTFMLGPVLINAVALVRHHLRLDKAPPEDHGGLQF